MHVLIRKLVDVAGDSQAHQDFEISTNRLTLGRGTDQDLLLPGERVAYQHADVRFRRGEPELRAHAATGVTVNGQNTHAARLGVGDEIRIGDHQLVVISPPEPHQDLALTVEKRSEAPGRVMREAEFVTGPERLAWLRPRPWAWLGFGLILLLGLVLPGMVAWEDKEPSSLRATPLPDDRIWNSGSTSQGHEFIGHKCENCHKIPFQQVPNNACTDCHDDMGRHTRARAAKSDFTGQRCADCHREHNGRDGVVMQDQQFCTDCHADIEAFAPDSRLRDVSDFADDHPDFRVRLLERGSDGDETAWSRTHRLERDGRRSRSGLKFNHKVHLADEGVENETGTREVMSCGDCHQPEAGGRGMQPIEMEKHCSRCHSLSFDEADPKRQVPHAEPDQVLQRLREYFSRRFIEDRPGRFEVELEQPGAPPAVDVLQEEGSDWVDQRTRQTASDVFERRVCTTCHKVTRTRTDDGPDWSIRPVKLNNDFWMHSARFSHAEHDNTRCGECHEAATSKQAGDILMPRIRTCRQCHTGAAGDEGLRSTCITCHRFHYRGHGQLEAP